MKNITFALTLLCICTNIFANPVQGTETATITDKFQIILPVDKPLADNYIINISALKFKDEQAAIDFFDRFNESIISFNVYYNKGEVILTITKEIYPDWKVDDWNKYFEARAPKMLAVYTMSNK